MGAIFDGTYKVVDLDSLKQYKIDSYIGYYQRCLHIIDSMRSAVEVLMKQYLSDTTKWLGISLVLGGHYGELGQDVLRQFGYTGIIIFYLYRVPILHCYFLSYMAYAEYVVSGNVML